MNFRTLQESLGQSAIPTQIAGVILRGGASRRFGSDKAEAVLGGVPMLQRVIARACPQVDFLALSGGPAGAHDAAHPTIVDPTQGEGPLGGILAGLGWARARGYALLATFPCDAPFFPCDLVERLRSGLGDGIDCVRAQRGEDAQYLFALWRTACEESVARAFASGLRSVRSVDGVLRCAAVNFPIVGEGPDGDAFFNLNRRTDLAIAAAWLERNAESQ